MSRGDICRQISEVASGEMYEEHGNKISKTMCFYVLLFFVLFLFGPTLDKLKSITQLPYSKVVELELTGANSEEENCNPGFAVASLQQYEQFRRIVLNSSPSNFEFDSKLQFIQAGTFSNSDSFLVKVQIEEQAELREVEDCHYSPSITSYRVELLSKCTLKVKTSWHLIL